MLCDSDQSSKVKDMYNNMIQNPSAHAADEIDSLFFNCLTLMLSFCSATLPGGDCCSPNSKKSGEVWISGMSETRNSETAKLPKSVNPEFLKSWLIPFFRSGQQGPKKVEAESARAV